MNSNADTSVNSNSTTSANWFVMGSVISLVSAMVLAWKGTICVDVLKILAARDLSELHGIGQQLGRVCWCPMGLAIGTTVVAAGFRLTALRGRLSQRAIALVALYGVVAACGAFFVFQGTGQARASMMVVAASDQAVKPEELLEAMSAAATIVARGWALMVVAQALLAAGGFFQLADQLKSSVGSLRWHKMANMALSLLWIFGAVVSIAWFRRSSEILALRVDEPIKAAAVVEMLNGVASMSWFGSLFLFAHAVSTVIVAATIYRMLARLREASRVAQPQPHSPITSL